jgi:hypothetical protein
MIVEFNADVRGISQLVANGTRTGLENVGESPDYLAYRPVNFATDHTVSLA